MTTEEEARLDQWLWAARFFKTRSLAAAAVDGGKVELNDEKPRRSRPVRLGDRIRVRLGPVEYQITVTGLRTKRGSAAVAAGLYREDEASRATRERNAEQHRLAAEMYGAPSPGKPGKKERRELERFRRRGEG